VSLLQIEIPESIKQLPHTARASRLIDDANDRLEAFMLKDQQVIENFVNCDFHLVDQAFQWIHQNHLLTGNRFCEFGSGFGVATMLAAVRGMESVGIEIESVLVAESSELADDVNVNARFYCGSFVPRGGSDALELEFDVEHVDTLEGDVYDEIGLEIDDFDLFFAFPWPGEHGFFESVFDHCAADGAMLLTYRGREGMNLVRKV